MKRFSNQRKITVMLGLGLLLFVVSIYSLAAGAIESSIGEVFGALISAFSQDSDNTLAAIVLNIRLPRLLLGILVGAGLALSGVVMQALFRNPMADPGLLGVSSGAALGAVISIVLGLQLFPGWYLKFSATILPVMAFCGGFAVLLIVYGLSKSNNRVDVPTMLLAGVAMNAITGAGIGMLSYIADDTQLRDLVFWSLGSLEITDWNRLFIAALIVFPVSVLISRHALALNANLLGENEARQLGFDVERLKIRLIVLVSIIVGVAVALSGIIGFIGLLVPHLLRLVIGPDHRILLPASALFGAILLITADIVARTAVSPAEMPIGIITAILGGPFFLWLLVRQRKKQAV